MPFTAPGFRFCATNRIAAHRLKVSSFQVAEYYLFRGTGLHQAVWSLYIELLSRYIAELFKNAVQFSTSIAWGDFSYHVRIKFPGIGKILFTETPTLPRFWTASGRQSFTLSECRLLREGLPKDALDSLYSKYSEICDRRS